MFPDFFNAALNETQEATSSAPAAGDGKAFVISLGGSLLFDEAVSAYAIQRIASSINSLQASGYKFAVVVGGGAIAREYISAAKELYANNFEMDELGILATRLNAKLVIKALDNAFPEVLTDITKAKTIVASGKIPVFGGLLPGVTTDFDAAILAEYLGASFINLSNVDGIYSSDPKKNSRAKLYRELSYTELLGILMKQQSKPGQNIVLDIPAALVLQRSNITAYFLNGNNMSNFEAAVRGLAFNGTIVQSGEENLKEEEEQEDEDSDESEEDDEEVKPRKNKKRKIYYHEIEDDEDTIAESLADG